MIASKIGPERLPAYQAAIFLTAVIFAIAIGVLYQNAPRNRMELKTEDVIARLAPQPARNDVVILALDDASVAKYGAVKSWPRSLLAAGLSKVEAGAPKVAVFDLALDKRTRTGDAALWREMANHRNVVLGMAFDANRGTTYTPDDIRGLVFLEKYALADNITYDPAHMQSFPYYLFEPPVSDYAGSSRGVGVFIRETDEDGVLRTARMVYRSLVQFPGSTAQIRGRFPQSNLSDGVPVFLPNLSLVSALRVFDMDKQTVFTRYEELSLAGRVTPPVTIPIDNQGRMEIRYAGSAGHFSRVSFADLMDNKVSSDLFKDKVVLIGATAANDTATDARMTPFPGLMPRVEVTANALATIMNRAYYSRYPERIIGILILAGLITGLCMMFVSGSRAVITGLLLLVGYILLSWLLFAFGSIMMPVLPVIVTILVTLLVAIALYTGPFKPLELEASPTYVPVEEQQKIMHDAETLREHEKQHR